MEKFLDVHAARSPLSGLIGNLAGMPDAVTLALWKIKAGMGKTSLNVTNNDTMFANLDEDSDSDCDFEA